MGDVTKINEEKRPDQLMLMDAITNSIYEMAEKRMSPIEILGVLEMVRLKIYQDHVLLPVMAEVDI